MAKQRKILLLIIILILLITGLFLSIILNATMLKANITKILIYNIKNDQVNYLIDRLKLNKNYAEKFRKNPSEYKIIEYYFNVTNTSNTDDNIDIELIGIIPFVSNNISNLYLPWDLVPLPNIIPIYIKSKQSNKYPIYWWTIVKIGSKSNKDIIDNLKKDNFIIYGRKYDFKAKNKLKKKGFCFTLAKYNSTNYDDSIIFKNNSNSDDGFIEIFTQDDKLLMPEKKMEDP